MIAGQLELQLFASMARLQSDMDKAKRTVSGAVDTMNKALGAIGVAISVDFLVGLAKKSNEYGKSLAALTTQISGATNQIKELDAASRSLSVQFGTDPIKQSAAFYEILSAGITDTKQATDLLTEANRLAIGGNADLMISVDGLTSIIKGYGGAAGTAAEISDTLFTASLAGKLSIQELSENIGKVIPLATTMGVSLEEVTAAISALTLGGISAKESVTGMRAILAAVAKPSSEAARLAKEIGLEFNSAAIQADGFAKFMEQVKTKTQGSSDQMAVLFGGVESLVPALALTGNAGAEFNNILGQMANKAGATEEAFNKMASSPGFKWDQFMATMTNIAITLGDALSSVLTPAAELAAKALNKLFGINNLSGVEKQIQLIGDLTSKVESMTNKKHVPIVGNLLFDKKEFDLLQHQLETAQADLVLMQKAQQSVGVAQKESTHEVIKSTVALEKNNAVVAKATQQAKERNKEFNIEIHKLKQYEDSYKKARDLTSNVATDQERYNQKLEELNQLKPYVTIETYNRALEKAQKELKGTEVQTRQTTDEVSQLWMQAGRNIQSSLANSIFNFFDDGLKGMLKNVISTVGRIASEFAALRIAQGVGLAGMFGSGAASAGGIGGTGSALNLASMGSSALNLFKVGGGISQGVSGLIGIGSTGTQAAAEAGAMSLWGASGASAGIGSSIASFAGPAIAVAAVDQIVRMLAGDKMIGGTAGKILNYVPVIGPLINGLFGRGPMKQQGTLLEGQIGAEGFESGMLQTRFKAKGGAFRSDKIDFSRVDALTGNTFTDNKKLLGFTDELAEAGKQIFDSINEATKQTTIALRGVAGNLGLATGGIDDFSYSLKILTEKGEMIQGEQIAEEIAKISEGLATSLLPGVKEFQRSGETATNTLVRLSTEFSVLTSAAGLLFDKSSKWSKDFVNQFSIGARSAFLEKAGGADAFAGMVAGFAQNFLTDEQRVKPIIEALVSERDKLGLSGINTRQQYTSAVQSGNLNPDQLIFLLSNQQAINDVFNYLGKFNESINETAEVAEEAAKNMFTMGGALQIYNNAVQQSASTIDNMVNSVNDLKNIAQSLSDTVNSINPMTADQARSQVMYGGANSPSLQAALGVLSNSSTAGFNNVLDFNRAKSGGVSAINGVRNSLDSQINKDERRIAELTAAYAMSNSSIYDSLRNVAKFETGGTVPRTGLAVLHKDEKVLTANESGDMANQIRELNVAVATLTIANNKMTRILDKWDGQGMPAERVA